MISVVVAGNLCHDNDVYGIAVSGNALLVEGNVLSGNGTVANNGAGILANVSGSRIAGNMVTGSAAFGIDAGGSIGSDVSGNFVAGPVNGIKACGSGEFGRKRIVSGHCDRRLSNVQPGAKRCSLRVILHHILTCPSAILCPEHD